MRSKFLYTRLKGGTEAAITQLRFKVIVILRPSFLDSQRDKLRLTRSVALGFGLFLSSLMVGLLRKFHPINV
jgi:uncharacterized protein YbjT (DUF2867 family)